MRSSISASPLSPPSPSPALGASSSTLSLSPALDSLADDDVRRRLRERDAAGARLLLRRGRAHNAEDDCDAGARRGGALRRGTALWSRHRARVRRIRAIWCKERANPMRRGFLGVAMGGPLDENRGGGATGKWAFSPCLAKLNAKSSQVCVVVLPAHACSPQTPWALGWM